VSDWPSPVGKGLVFPTWTFQGRISAIMYQVPHTRGVLALPLRIDQEWQRPRHGSHRHPVAW
jgi:hypothetical protein